MQNTLEKGAYWQEQRGGAVEEYFTICSTSNDDKSYNLREWEQNPDTSKVVCLKAASIKKKFK